MKALTICQPYAELIVRGTKDVENRTWPTNYRGPLAIHAGKSRSWLDDDNYDIPLDDMTFGAIIGIAELVECVELEKVERPGPLDWLHWDRFAHGPWCWVLDNVRRIDPIPYRGRQGLFEVDDELIPKPAERKLP